MKTVATLLILLLPFISFGQKKTASITSNLIDEEGQPVSYANVVLNNLTDSSLVKVELSDDNGDFALRNIAPGSYYVEVTFVGFLPHQSDAIELNGENVKLPTIEMKTFSTQISEVVVTAERPLLELKDDKMIFNVENSINAAGNTALELLKKSPGVIVDNNDNISILGRTGVKIYIDDKPSPLRGADLAAYLNSLQSNAIDAIEIITNPGSKYEAEGNAGIINIRLKKDESLGANANISLGYSQGDKSRYNGSITSNYRNRHVNIFGNYGYSSGSGWFRMDMFRRQFGFELNQVFNRNWEYDNHNFKFGTDFFLSEKSTLGFIVDGNISDRLADGHTRSLLGTVGSESIDSILIAGSDDDRSSKNYTFNLNYQLNTGEEGKLNIDMDYGLYRTSSTEYQPNRYMDPSESIVLFERINRTIPETMIDIYAVKADYEGALWNGKLGAGFKVSYVETDNDFNFYNVINGEDILDFDRTNRFVYQEQINAAYLNYSRKISDAVNFQVGLRAEHTESTGDLTSEKVTENARVDRDYLNVFPSASLNVQGNGKHIWQLSYSRRIDRPNYQNLNPFEYKLDELSFRKGNPFLRPEYTNNFQLRHSYNHRITTTFSFSHTTDLITNQTMAVEGKVGNLVSINLADQYNYSINVAAPVSIADWWSTYSSVTGYYRENKGDFGDDGVIDLAIKAVNIYSQQTFKMPWETSLELSGYYSSPSVWGGNIKTESQWSIDLGIQRKFLEGKGNIKLSVSDIFKTQGWDGLSTFGPLYLDIRGRFDSRRFNVNVSYLLGNRKVKQSRRRRTATEEEQSRTRGEE